MKKICGIYVIENLIDGRKYIGQSKCVAQRLKTHRNQLAKGTHKNLALQESWNEVGEENFDFRLLEECELDELNELERHYIKKYGTNNSDKGFNITPGGKPSLTIDISLSSIFDSETDAKLYGYSALTRDERVILFKKQGVEFDEEELEILNAEIDRIGEKYNTKFGIK